MFRVNFSIELDTSLLTKYSGDVKNYLLRSGKISRHKAWEVQVSRMDIANLISAELDLRWRGRDHAGPRIEIECLGFYACAQICDVRHWNYDENRWPTDEEIEADIEEWRSRDADQ